VDNPNAIRELRATLVIPFASSISLYRQRRKHEATLP